FSEEQYAEGARREEIIQELARIFGTRTAEEWFERLRPSDVCVTPVRNAAEAAAHLGLARGHSVVVPGLSETPGRLGGRPPRLGEHSHEVTGEG
ncbi:MAG TPA: CoA transferase, partial [Bryobacteraceae bacterium]|nr:CoA transferase [Bryobacteraceae bacterium]